MKEVCNVVTQTEHDSFPKAIDNVLNPSPEMLAQCGWFRLDQTEPTPSPGCRQTELRYIGDMDSLTARKVIVKEVDIADEKAANEAAAVAATIEWDKAANERLEQMAVDLTRSLTFRVLIALAERKEATTEKSVYAEVRKQLELPAK